MSNKYSDKIIDDVLNLLLIISNKYEILTYIVEDKGQELYEDKIDDGKNIFECVNESQFLIKLINN